MRTDIKGEGECRLFLEEVHHARYGPILAQFLAPSVDHDLSLRFNFQGNISGWTGLLRACARWAAAMPAHDKNTGISLLSSFRQMAARTTDGNTVKFFIRDLHFLAWALSLIFPF